MNFKALPPCRAVLLNKIKRTNAIAAMFKNACQSIVDIPQITDGYTISDHGLFEIEYVTGSPFPEQLADISLSDSSDDERDVYSESEYSEDSGDSDNNEWM